MLVEEGKTAGDAASVHVKVAPTHSVRVIGVGRDSRPGHAHTRGKHGQWEESRDRMK
jgi:hypothetical protein